MNAEGDKTERMTSTLLPLLQVSAYLVIVAWGIMAASHILSVVLIALLMTYVILPFPKWLMHRFRLSKSAAIVLTLVFVVVIHLVVSGALFGASLELRKKLPIYEGQINNLHERLDLFLSAHGVQSTQNSIKNVYSYDRIVELGRKVFPSVVSLISDRLAVFLLSLVFLIEMVDSGGAKSSRLGRHLDYYGVDVRRFIAISAQTGAINAVANLILLVVLGVDFPVVWCFLYFFLHFIPNVGFVVSLVPPSLLALLMHGWKRALLVVGGLILTEMLGDYVVKPMLMKKELDISLLEILLSLMVWGFLLGPAGAILAIPLTLALRKFIDSPLTEKEFALAQAPG